jgi:hypothetical protein
MARRRKWLSDVEGFGPDLISPMTLTPETFAVATSSESHVRYPETLSFRFARSSSVSTGVQGMRILSTPLTTSGWFIVG